MGDFIRIEGLEIFANHGVFEEEVSLGQKFIISAVLYFDVSGAGLSDDLSLSVNYAKACKFISEYMKSNTFKLIETVAERLARAILLEYPILDGCDITVKKPWAPIGLPLECVSVTVSRKWHTAYLSVGSNMGDCEMYLNNAVKALGEVPEISVEKVSSFIKTKPYGGVPQDDFLNGALKIRTLYSPLELLDFINKIESENQRVREVVWGPRTLDIDIVLFDDLIIESERLTIPHCDMCNRDFVLIPMNEIAPGAVHPVRQKTIAGLLEEYNRIMG